LEVLEESKVNNDNTISDSFLERAITTHMFDNDVTSEDLNQDGNREEKPKQVEQINDENNLNTANQKVREEVNYCKTVITYKIYSPKYSFLH
jgi:hypothetical protein